MQLIRHRPTGPLAAYVDCFWWSRRDHPLHAGEHMLPSGRAQLIFALHEATIVCRPDAWSPDATAWSRGIVHGPQSRYYQSGSKPPGVVVGVAFRSGAAGEVLGVPMAELTDRHVAIDALWGSRGLDIREHLLSAGSAGNVFRVLEQELTARLKGPLLIHPAIARTLLKDDTNGWTHSRIADMQREAGCSPKHFIALFRAAVGLTPKHYARVQRFNAVLRGIAARSDEGLADLAASAGYADQAHMTREFREFAGISPTQYRPRDPGSYLHHQSR